MIERSKRRYEQEKWANAQTIQSIRALPASAAADERYQRALDKLAHILVARQVWFERLTDTPARSDGDKAGLTLDEIVALNDEVEREWDGFLGTLDDALLRNVVDYTAGGERYSSSVEDVLLHVFTHGFYHRGQIASLVNALGGTPANTGFIYWARGVMARVEPSTHEIRGEPVTIRTAEPADADTIIAFRVAEHGSHGHDVTTDAEIMRDPLEQRAWIRRRFGRDRDLCLLGETERLIGILTVTAPRRERMAHRVGFGMSVSQTHRGRGVGRAMIDVALRWARAHPGIEILELGCLSTNERALALYRRLGFVEEARVPRVFRLGPGRYADDVVMSIPVA